LKVEELKVERLKRGNADVGDGFMMGVWWRLEIGMLEKKLKVEG
jgi:hypothetical protein